uniref:MAP2/Tau projection domain-containing protein n=1 Tax=Monopterus albus TaxID=43700 RepID=A0A3Q3PZD2_MONAL
MADSQQPDDHWASHGQENGENGYTAYSSGYRENGYHGGAAAHPGTTVDDSANLPPSPPPSPSAEQIGPVAQEDKVEVVSQQQEEKEAPEERSIYQEEVAYEQPGHLPLEQTDYLTEPQALGFQRAQTPEVLNGGSHQGEHSPSQKAQPEERISKAPSESAIKEDEPQVVSPHGEQVVVERATSEGAELALTEPPPPSLKEKDLSDNAIIEQGNENRKEEATESHLLVESKPKEAKQHSPAEESSKPMTEDRHGIVSPSKSGAPVEEFKEKVGTIEVITNKGQECGSDIRLHDMPFTGIPEVDPKQETEPATELKQASDIFLGHEPGVESYFETSSKLQREESTPSQSYYELSTAAETKLSGETGRFMKNLEEDQEKKGKISPSTVSLEEQSFSLNITVESSEGQAVNEKNSRTFSKALCPISGSFDDSEISPSTPSEESHKPTLDSTDSPEDIHTKAETPRPFEQSSSFSEMLDLAGALPLPSLERREVDHMRRKSVPADVSALVGSSLSKLTLRDQTTRVVGRENQLEELGYCVFNEYSGPMPSPADVPSPGDSPHQHFPSMEGEVEEEHGATEAECIQKGIQEPDHKGIEPEISQKTVTERKDPPVKSTLILEKAVTSGVKPDRLRIPMTSSKDRLSGLPGEIKIHAIPEVEIEKDPSREASPIPPDSSFTFIPTETGSQAPLTPTSPKSLNNTLSESQNIGENVGKDILLALKTENDPKSERINNTQSELDKEMSVPEEKVSEKVCEKLEMPDIDIDSASSQSQSTEKDDKKIESEYGIHAKIEGQEKHETSKAVQDFNTERPTDEKDDQIQLQEVTLEKGSPKPQISSPVIIIPQAQIEEEAEDEDDIEFAEEPQEIMEKAEELFFSKTDQAEVGKEEQKKEEVRLMIGDQMLEEDPKSGAEEWSHSALYSDNGEPETDSSHLSPCSDNDLSQPTEEGGRDEGMVDDKLTENPQINRTEGKKEGCEGVKKDQIGEGEEGSGKVHEEKEEKAMEEKDEGEERTEDKYTEVVQDVVVQDVEEVSDMLCQTSRSANDETTMDVSILDTDSGWMDSQDDKSIMTEQIEVLPHIQSPTSTPVVVDRPAKRALCRGRGHPGITESKVSRKVPSHHPTETMKKKKVGMRRADQNKVSALQTRSPNRKIIAKAAARHPRSALLHGSARRKATGLESHQPLSVAHQSRERTTCQQRTFLHPIPLHFSVWHLCLHFHLSCMPSSFMSWLRSRAP